MGSTWHITTEGFNVGTLVDDNEVQKPYRFTITIGNMEGYDTVGTLSFPVVVHSDDVFYIYSRPSASR